MASDESITILHLCTKNLVNCVREVVFSYFDDVLQAHIHQSKLETYRERVPHKSQKKFQVSLQTICKSKPEFEKERAKFEDRLLAGCPYLKELLEQITKVQIILLSKIRKSNIDSLEIESPDISKFCSAILEKNCFSIFHNVEPYYKCYIKKNPMSFKDVVDSNTETVLNDLHSVAYASFFTGKPVLPQTLIDVAINNSRVDGAIPDDVDREYKHCKDDDPESEHVDEIKEVHILHQDTEYSETNEPVVAAQLAVEKDVDEEREKQDSFDVDEVLRTTKPDSDDEELLSQF